METENKIQKKQCEICGKTFESLYPDQLRWNFKAHMDSHDFHQEEENDNGTKEV